MAKEIFRKVLPTLPPFDEKEDMPDGEADYPRDEFPIDTRPLWDVEVIDLPRGGSEDPEQQVKLGDHAGAVEGSIRDCGLDVLAFYKSYRFLQDRPYPGKWGVFFVNSGVNHIAHMLSLEFPKLQDPREIALDFLWAHELYHAKFDVSVLPFEAHSHKQLYRQQKAAFRRRQTQQPEEALANLAAWDYAKTIDCSLSQSRKSHNVNEPGIADFFHDFMKSQPGAYSRFDEPRADLQSETAAGIFKGRRYPGAQCDELSDWIGLVPSFACNKSAIPRHLVIGVDYRKLVSPARYIPVVRDLLETPKFLKDLIPEHKTLWHNTKKKLLASACLPGLDFKFWEEPQTWSVRVNGNFRAHMSPICMTSGTWQANSYGNHKKMGHG